MTELRRTVETYWSAAEARDWSTFATTLSDDVVYELPQTRERIRGKDAYVRFNREYPDTWHISVHRLVADAGSDHVATWVHAVVGLEEMHAVTFFTGDDVGRITTVTDFWPEAYEPPPGREHLVERY
ncbi:nuclear transport factor 2 family protein [Streptomyces sp. NBC_01167]|uniref:nuclear transport factor 2 family protein n=1 Tax=Streptomyces sp. NBC_01167 TaxID=2903756 RepID=UPI00386974C7|nr:nuclear transport factor 2 family protein [Streptomyces sp. NBC_01167]